jgi:hypothetical protein
VQVGTVIDGGEGGSVTKKQQKLSMLNELMSDASVKRRAKNQFLKASPAFEQTPAIARLPSDFARAEHRA